MARGHPNERLKMAKPNPFEKSGKDKDTAAERKRFGKEGSKKEEAYDKREQKPPKKGK